MYDIIGDVHGHADELEHLLQKMGYKKEAGLYAHPQNRKAVFVGDYIDRGPKVREALHLVKSMCDAGHAKAVMGNHEFNAICYHSPDIKEGGYFRPHSEKNKLQHRETLKAFENHDDEWTGFLEWFKSLPLYLDLEPFRVVHACWDQKHINWIDEHYKGITSYFLRKATNKEAAGKAYKVIEDVLKGKEYSLPEGVFFTDKDGTRRYECRTKWWTHADQRETYGDVLMECPDTIAADDIESPEIHHRYNKNRPVFFGHYWLRGDPQLNHSKAVCLDYSVAKGGKLVAYRWDGPELSEDQFIYG